MIGFKVTLALLICLAGCSAPAGPGCGEPAPASDGGAAGEAGATSAPASVCSPDTVLVHLLRPGYGGKAIPYALGGQYGNCTAPADSSEQRGTVFCCPRFEECAVEGAFAACANVNPSSCASTTCTCTSPLDGVSTCFDP